MPPRFTGHWEVMGAGAPVLCIPGFASGNWIFRSLVEPLCGEHQFILPDNRGMGQSPPATAPYRLDDLSADLLGLMDDLGHQRFAVVGLSMGGFVAQLMALQAPQRVERLALLCTSSGGEEFKPLFPVLPRQQVEAIYRFTAHERISAALSPALCPLLATRYPQVHAQVFRERLARMEDPAQVLLQYDAVEQFLATPLPLSAIACPTLILSGDRDLLVPLGNAQLLADKLPNAVLQVIPDTDHLFFLEKSLEVSAVLADFLQ